MEHLSKNAVKLHFKLPHLVTPELWKIIDAIVAMKADCAYIHAHNRHSSKMEKILNNKKDSRGINAKNMVNLLPLCVRVEQN
jgi:hypothetical protein